MNKDRRGLKGQKKILALLLVIAMIVTSIPSMGLVARAASTEDTRITDDSTIDNWKRYFGDDVKNTVNAGGIWTDKSVFKDATKLAPVTMKDNKNNFLIAMSAIAANKSITGYSTIPTDTMLVLDLSGSMVDNTATSNQNDTTDARVRTMVDSANDAIKELLDLNQNNRVGVVLYSGNSSFGTSNTGTATLLLPLDRYTIGSEYIDNTGTQYKENDFLQVDTNNGIRVRVAQGEATWWSDEEVMVKNDDGNFVTAQNKRATGGTYTQNGMYLAWKEFEKVDDTVIQDSFQAGTKRMPIMVLMSDGAPTTATTNYYNVGTSNVGNGAGSCATDPVGFLTQLTAAWTRSSMQSHYNNTPKIYTLGYGLSALASGQEVAESVLDPENSTTGIDDLWRNYISATGNALTVHNAPGTSSNQNGNPGSQTIQVSKNARITSIEQQNYVDQYFAANNEDQLEDAFADIVDQIILQSKYYPTEAEDDRHHLGGYISFEDDLGHFMEVKDLKGLLLGNTLYDGAKMAETILGGGLGTAANPTKLGDEFIFSVVDRLGLESNAAARELVRQAWLAGQLSYTNENEYSNYIGWYADKDNKYLGFWSEEHTAEDVPANAVYTMKSYGYMGYDKITSEESIKDSDLMYMTVRIQEEIATGHQAVHWSVPAALIPTITYKVSMEGRNYEEAAQLDNIQVEIQKANPVRLVYEVGLVDEVNELTVADIMAQEDHVHTAPDGSYYFYTNKWGDSDDDGQTNIDYTNPYSHEVTTVDYQPSIENERYYYIEDSVVYVKSGDRYNPVNYDPKGTAGTYYHGRKIFSYDETAGKWKIETYYEQITNESLAKATKYNDKNEWYIPAGTILRYNEQYRLDKENNRTGTLQYVTYPFIYNPTPETDENYHSDVFLGNNGRITLTPATGIKLTKTVDTVAPATQTNNFEFVITLDAPAGVTLAASYPAVVFDAVGNQVGEEFNVAVDANGKMATITLADGQTIYIKDLPADTTYEIVENAHADYLVESINGDENAEKAEGTIKDKVLDNVEFVNTLKTHGSLIISKTVTHPLGNNYIIPDGIEFTVNVDLNGTNVANAELEIVRAANTGKINTDGEGRFSFKIKASESVAINNIPSGAKYSISETGLPKGFALNTAESTALEGTVLTDVNATERLLNEYNPDNASPVNITLEGTKTVEGRRWLDSDRFAFELQKYESGQWVTIGTQKTVSVSNKSFNFTAEMQREVFDAVGTYQYRVIEVEGTIGGITYDKAIRYFDVNVTDTDMDGKLEIATTDGVHGTAPTVVSSEVVSGETVYHIVTDFTNKYAPIGSAHFEIDIHKTIANTTGVDVPLSDFSFELYEATVTGNNWAIGNKVTESTKTNALGEAVVGMVYEPNDLTEADGAGGTTRIEEKTYYYILKENVPADKIKGMDYTDKEYKVTVLLKDNLDGTMSTVVSVDGVLDTETSNVAEADFENVFDLGETKVSLKASKKLTGRDMTAGEFTFGLYEANEQFVIGNMIGRATNGAAQNNAVAQFAFEPVQGYADKFDANNNLVFTAVGTYHYIVREIIPQQIEHNGIQYDTTEYNVIITITDNGNGGLASQISLENATYTEEVIAFVNTYMAADTTEDFQGRKILENRTLLAGEFSFELYETASDYKTDGLIPVEETKNTSTGVFAFTPIKYNQVGTHYYVIKEIVPKDTDNNPTDSIIYGVKYDSVVYNIKVEVTDDGSGKLQTVTTVNNVVDDPIIFTNKYHANSVQVPITLSKTLTGRNMAADEFTFQLVDENSQVVKEVKNGAAKAGEASTFTFESLTFDRVGVYHYKVQEALPDVNDRLGGVVYDRTEYDVEITITDDGKGQLQASVKVDDTENKDITFTNGYAASDTSTVIRATKTLEGRNLSDGEFFFDLRDSSGKIIQSRGNTPTGEVVFDAILYDKAGEYVYTLAERDTGKEGITYDKSIYYIKVIVEDNQKGELEAKPIISKSADLLNPVTDIHFNNTYKAADGAVQITGVKKILTGRELLRGEFEFQLIVEEAPIASKLKKGDVVATAVNGKVWDKTTQQYINTGAVDEIVFDNLVYEHGEDGTYKYKIVEDASNGLSGITYDATEYYVIIEVSRDDSVAKMIATEPVITDSNGSPVTPVFTNVYTAPHIVAEKTQSIGGEPTKGTVEVVAGKEVTYYIKVTNDGTALAKDIVIEDKVPAGLEIVKDSITGGKKSVVKDGIISWTIDELEAGKSVVVSFKAVIPVVEKNTTWENVATVVYGNNPDKKDDPEETNKVVLTSKKASPVTGDNTSMTLWIGLAVVSMTSVAVVVDKKRKSEKTE